MITDRGSGPRSTYEKGYEGEEYVMAKIAACGYEVLYVGGQQHYHKAGAHYYSIDLLCFGKGRTFSVQVKHKEPRTHFSDTGMKPGSFEELVYHQKISGQPVLVLFTDASGRIYGGWVDDLPSAVSEPWKQSVAGESEMVYWLLSKLYDYKDLLGCRYPAPMPGYEQLESHHSKIETVYEAEIGNIDLQ